jgi:hypothetical protein
MRLGEQSAGALADLIDRADGDRDPAPWWPGWPPASRRYPSFLSSSFVFALANARRSRLDIAVSADGATELLRELAPLLVSVVGVSFRHKTSIVYPDENRQTGQIRSADGASDRYGAGLGGGSL